MINRWMRRIVRSVAREVAAGIREAQPTPQAAQQARLPVGSQTAAAERACAELQALRTQENLRRAFRANRAPEPPARA